eukprot:754954-Hanusia_phi.AAC.2
MSWRHEVLAVRVKLVHHQVSLHQLRPVSEDISQKTPPVPPPSSRLFSCLSSSPQESLLDWSRSFQTAQSSPLIPYPASTPASLVLPDVRDSQEERPNTDCFEALSIRDISTTPSEFSTQGTTASICQRDGLLQRQQDRTETTLVPYVRKHEIEVLKLDLLLLLTSFRLVERLLQQLVVDDVPRLQQRPCHEGHTARIFRAVPFRMVMRGPLACTSGS